MRNVLVAALVSLIVSLLGTPFAIRLFRRRGYGQLIRDDGPTTHHTKRGTPTMGGTVIILATLLGYAVAHLAFLRGVTSSGLLVLMLMTGLGAVGFIDDFIKIRKQRSLGLTATAKFGGQAVVAIAFGVLATRFVHKGLAPASTPRRCARRYRDGDAHGAAADRSRRALRRRGVIGHRPGDRLPAVPSARVQHGSRAPSLRARGLEREHGHRPVLDHRRARRGVRPRCLLRRVPVPGPVALTSSAPPATHA